MEINTNEQAVRNVLLAWAEATRVDARNDILRNHATDAVIFDVLPPLQYHGTKSYQASWDEWQPEPSSDSVFEFTDLTVSAAQDKAYAFGIIQCGGQLPDGSRYEDTVRATFCLDRMDSEWIIAHQHISMPMGSQ